MVADGLLALNDPRGLFIQLQCLEHPDDDARRRAAHLARTYGAGWLGPLTKVIQRRWGFRHGFLFRASLRSLVQPALTGNGLQAFDAPEWSTLRNLDLSGHPPLEILARLPRLEGVCGVRTPEALYALLEGPPRSIWRLGFEVPLVARSGALNDELLRRFSTVRQTFPALREVWTVAHNVPHLDVLDLDTIVVEGHWWPGLVAGFPTRVRRLGFVLDRRFDRPFWMAFLEGETLTVTRLQGRPHVPKMLLPLLEQLRNHFVIRRLVLREAWWTAAPPNLLALERLWSTALWVRPGHRAPMEEVVFPAHWPVRGPTHLRAKV